MCRNVWYTFGKKFKIKFDGVSGRIRKYRLMYNMIVLIYSQGPIKHNIEISESFIVTFNFYSRLNLIFWRNSQNGQWKMNFFSVQRNFEANLYSTYVVQVGITFLGRRDLTIKKLPGMPLKIKWRLGTIPKAYELSLIL